MKTISLPVHKKLLFESPLSSAIPMPDKGYLLYFTDAAETLKVDEHFKVDWRKDLHINSDTHISIAADGSRIGLTEIDKVRIHDGEGNLLFTFPHGDWDEFLGAPCFFQQPDVIWFITPSQEEDDVLHVLDGNTFQIIDKIGIPGHNCNAYEFHATPDHKTILLQSSAGQEEAHIFSIRLADNKIELADIEAGYDRIIGSFSPDGKELVTAPHYEEEIEVLSFPDLEVIRSIGQEALWNASTTHTSKNDEDSVDYQVVYLNDKYIMVKTRWGRFILLDKATLQPTAEFILDENKITAYDSSGEETTNPDDIFDYEGEISSLQLNPYTNELFAIHPSGMLLIYENPL